jgi:hypothetical protein
MPKTKTLEEHLEMAPPVAECISAHYLIKVPATDEHLKAGDKLNAYALRVLEKKLGDDLELKSLKVKQPGISAKTMAKLRGKLPDAKIYVTVDF